jgi:hypothetical protein
VCGYPAWVFRGISRVIVGASATTSSVIEYADVVDWLAAEEPGCAATVIFDPPYAVGSPLGGGP